MKKYTLQALDEGNITFLKIDRSQAERTWSFIEGLIFWPLSIVIAYFAIALLAEISGGLLQLS